MNVQWFPCTTCRHLGQSELLIQPLLTWNWTEVAKLHVSGRFIPREGHTCLVSSTVTSLGPLGHPLSCACKLYNTFVKHCPGTRDDAVGWGTTLQAGRSWIRFPMGSLVYSMTKYFWPHYGPGVDSASHRKGYQEYLLGIKAAGA